MDMLIFRSTLAKLGEETAVCPHSMLKLGEYIESFSMAAEFSQ